MPVLPHFQMRGWEKRLPYISSREILGLHLGALSRKVARQVDEDDWLAIVGWGEHATMNKL